MPTRTASHLYPPHASPQPSHPLSDGDHQQQQHRATPTTSHYLQPMASFNTTTEAGGSFLTTPGNHHYGNDSSTTAVDLNRSPPLPPAEHRIGVNNKPFSGKAGARMYEEQSAARRKQGTIDHIEHPQQQQQRERGATGVASRSGKYVVLSVVCLSVSIATLLICVSSAIVLGVTISYSLKAADEFALSYSHSNVLAAANKVNDFVKIPTNTYAEIRAGALLGDFPNFVVPPPLSYFSSSSFYLPPYTNNGTSNHANCSAADSHGNSSASVLTVDHDGAWHLALAQQWLSSFQRMLYGAEFSLMIISIGFEDQTLTACTVTDKETFSRECFSTNPRNVSHTALGRGLYRAVEYYADTQYTSDLQDSFDYDPRTRAWYRDAPKTFGARPRFSSIYIAAIYNVLIVDVTGPFYHKDGTFLGVSSISLDLGQIAKFIGHIPRTVNAVIVLTDERGLLVGASDGGSMAVVLPYNATKDGPLADECERSGSTQICRVLPINYANDAVRAVARGPDADAFVSDGASFTRKTTLNGENWIVSKEPIESATDVVSAEIGWQISTIMPVSDVTSSIVFGRNVGITVAAVIIALSSVICGMTLFFLLRPLAELAKLMEQASRLRDESLTANFIPSRIYEIRTIQEAFRVLSGQLRRAKSFLPASLLAQMESTDEENDDMRDFEDEEDEEGDFIDEGFSRGGTASIFTDTDARPVEVTSVSTRGARSQSVTPQTSSLRISAAIGRGKAQQGGVGGGYNLISNTPGCSRVRGASAGSANRARVGPASHSKASSELTQTTISHGLEPHLHRPFATTATLSSRYVTVAALNLGGFNQNTSNLVAAGAGAALENFYATLIHSYQELAKESRGILDSFHGDRFFFTFNAVKPCSAHASMATATMLRIVEGTYAVLPNGEPKYSGEDPNERDGGEGVDRGVFVAVKNKQIHSDSGQEGFGGGQTMLLPRPLSGDGEKTVAPSSSTANRRDSPAFLSHSAVSPLPQPNAAHPNAVTSSACMVPPSSSPGSRVLLENYNNISAYSLVEKNGPAVNMNNSNSATMLSQDIKHCNSITNNINILHTIAANRRDANNKGSKSSNSTPTVTCGVASGRCLVGILGSDSSKRFAVVGHPFTYATVLERLGKLRGVGVGADENSWRNAKDVLLLRPHQRDYGVVLMSSETCVDAESQIAFLFTDVIRTPSGRVAPVGQAIGVRSLAVGGGGNNKQSNPVGGGVRGGRSGALFYGGGAAGGDEWMYEMNSHYRHCNYHACNNAFRNAMNGDAENAKALLTAFDDENNSNDNTTVGVMARSRVEEIIRCGPIPTSLGRYYDECVVSAHGGGRHDQNNNGGGGHAYAFRTHVLEKHL